TDPGQPPPEALQASTGVRALEVLQSRWRAPDRAAIARALTELFPESSRPLHVLPALDRVRELMEDLRRINPEEFERLFPPDGESQADPPSGGPDPDPASRTVLGRALDHTFPPAP